MTTNIILVIGAVLLGSVAHGLKCSEQESVTRHVLCYYEGRTSLKYINLCNCTHIVLNNVVTVANNYRIDLSEDAKASLEIINERKQSLTKLFTFTPKEFNFLESEGKSVQIINEIDNILNNFDLDGVEVNFPLTAQDTASKDSVTSFIKALKRKIGNSSLVRVKRAGYDVSENVQDDITTAPYRTQTNKTTRGSDKYQTTKKSPGKRRKNHRSRYGRRDQEEDEMGKEEKTETRLRRTRKELRDDHGYRPSTPFVMVRLPIQPEIIAKKFDLKALSRYADLLVVSTYNITDESELELTYHPSRLMGLSDMLNADSILDFLSGLGVEKSKIVLTLPATILKFQLEDDKKSTPRSPRAGRPEIIDQSQLCSFFSSGNWTVERDDDLTAPYAFYNKTWLAYEDKISVSIKAKYILLRELAGGGIYPIDADTGRDPCNDTSPDMGYLVDTLYENFVKLNRKPRGLVLESLQQDIHDTTYSAIDAGVHQSEYRIVRVVDHSGAVHVIRRNTKTEFECSRQGYFSHPLGCNKFYRCVKFNQYIDDFTVFEYDCPAGLAFDERWEVCVWPGSLPHGAPCTGSSEIAPVPRSHYQCPSYEGYYADPENCRWFFACLDHARDGVTPLTAYEFRCPFGLVFNEQILACDWPWNVGACGNRGFSGVIAEHHGVSSSLQSATLVKTGGFGSNFGASFSHEQGASFQPGLSYKSAGAANSGFGYIAGHFDDYQDRASFATVPDYEVSGGRILNRGGLVLNQNINFRGISGDINALNKLSSSFSHSQKSQNGAYGSAYINEATIAPVVHAPTPAPAITKQNQFVYDPPLSSPRPFSVRVPEVQINQEEHSSGSSFTLGSTTPRAETFAFASGITSGSINSFSVSSETVEDNAFVHENAGFGQKINAAFAPEIAQKQFEIHASTPSLVDNSQIVHSGYDKVSQSSVSTVGHDSNSGSIAIDTSKVVVTPKAFQKSDVHLVSADVGNNYRGSSTTPASSHLALENFEGGDADIFVTPKSDVTLYQGAGIKYQSDIYGASNSSEIFINHPLVEVSTPVPFNFHGFGGSGKATASSFSGSAAGIFDESVFRSKSDGNDIFLEEHAKRVAVPKISPTIASSVSYDHSSVSVKSASSSSAAKTTSTLGTTVVTVEPQNFIGPIDISSPAPLPQKSSILQYNIASSPASNVLNSAEPLVLVQPKLNEFQVSDRTKFLHPIASTPAPIEDFESSKFVTGNFGDRTNNQIAVAKEVSKPPQTPALQFPQIILSTPSPSVYKAPEYLPPVQSKIIVQPTIQAKVISPAVSSPAPAVYGKSEYVSSGVGFDQGVLKDITVLKPVVQTQKVTIPAPTVFKRPQSVASGFPVEQGHESLKVAKPAVQSFSQVLPASKVYKAPEYLPPVQTVTTIQENPRKLVQAPLVQSKFVQPTVSTPAPSVSVRPEYGANGITIGQGYEQLKSSVQQNIQTYSRAPDELEVKLVQPVITTPAPNTYSAPEYLPPLQINRKSQLVSGVHVKQERIQSKPLQHNIQTYSETPLVQVNFVQPVISTPAPTILRKPEYTTNVQLKPVVQENVRTYSEVPVVQDVKFLQPTVSTPAVSVYKAPEYLPPVKVNEYGPVVQTRLVQPVVSTPVSAIFRLGEAVANTAAVEQGNIKHKSSVQQNIQSHARAPVQDVKLVQPVVSSPIPTVYKAPEYLPPVEIKKYRPIVHSRPLTSTPATGFKRPESVTSSVTVEQGHFSSGVSVLKPVTQQIHQVSSDANLYRTPEYLPPVIHQPAELKSMAEGNLHINLQQQDVRFSRPLVSTPAPAVASVQQNQYLRLNQQPVGLQTYNFVSTTTTGPITYEEKEISETVSFPPPIHQQEILRTRAKAKQLFDTVLQPEVPVHYHQSLQRVTTPVTYGLNSPSPSLANEFGYQSISTPLLEVSTPKSEILETPVTPKPTLVIEPIRDEKLSPISVTQNAIQVEHSTSKPHVYEEYVSISSPKPEVVKIKIQSPDRLQDPIIVTESPEQNIIKQVILQPRTLQRTKQQKTVSYENLQKSNPVVSVLEKEIVQPVIQQKTYRVSSEPVDYLPPTGQEIESYSNFEFQKIVKDNTDFNAEDGSFYSAGGHSYESGRDNEGKSKVNSNIEIAPPPDEYLLELTPKFFTTTAAPVQTATVFRERARPTTSTEKYSYNQGYGTDPQSKKATVISVGQVDDEELENGNVESLLEKYSGEFGNVLGREKFATKVVEGEDRGKIVVGSEGDSSTVDYDVSTSRSRTRGRFKSTHTTEEDDTTVASLDLKNLKLSKNKKTVIIVSQVSDANPLLIGKLAGQCSCQSNKLQLRKKVARLKGRTKTTTHIPPLIGNDVTTEKVLDSLATEAVAPQTSSANVIFIDGSRSPGKSHERKIGRVLFTPEEPQRPVSSRNSKIGEINELGQALFTPVSAAEIARTEDFAGPGSKMAVGPSFDRYGPGGLRGFDETLQGSVDCERPGLFRHPKYCNKFYACNYDPWKKRYTLHVFNCPVHLSYDSSISACNWPSKGPACSDDHLLI